MASDERVRLGLIGAGSMGGLHARVISSSECADLAWVVDPDESRGRLIADRYETRWLPESSVDDIDGVVIAAPTELHDDLGRRLLESAVPLLVEKPLTDSLESAAQLVEVARASGVVLMCGLLERFNPAVRTALGIARDPVHATSVRHSPYAPRISTGVAGDLMIHDVDIVLRLFGSDVRGVAGSCGVFDERSRSSSEDVVDATLQFVGGGLASLSASRLSQRKIRTLSIVELDRMIEVDLLRQGVTIYRHVDSGDFDEDAGYRHQSIIDIPVLRHVGEPLQLQLQHFVALVRGDLDAEAELDSILPAHRVVADVLAACAR